MAVLVSRVDTFLQLVTADKPFMLQSSAALKDIFPFGRKGSPFCISVMFPASVKGSAAASEALEEW